MKICVYCSASDKIHDHYKLQAELLGNWIARNGHTLVFGGATGGLMSAVSKGASAFRGNIIGIITKNIMAAGRENKLVTEQIVVDTMVERKAALKAHSDIFIVLPGSYGTLDEMFDVIASGTVGEHSKPIIIVNETGFYDDLKILIERMKRESFIPAHENYSPQWTVGMNVCIKLLEDITQH